MKARTMGLLALLTVFSCSGPQRDADPQPEISIEELEAPSTPEQGDPFFEGDSEVADENFSPGQPGTPITNLTNTSGAEFRAATWNLFRMTVRKANRANPFSGITATTTAAVPLEVLAHYDVVVAGLQEVYLATRTVTDIAPPDHVRTPDEQSNLADLLRTMFTETAADHPLLNGSSHGGFTIEPGAAITTWRDPPVNSTSDPHVVIRWLWSEYCPIAYRSPITCSNSRVERMAKKSAHVMDCHLTTRPEKEFAFACMHFPATQTTLRPETSNEIAALGNFRAQNANVIIAVDANSNPHGHLQTYWQNDPANAGIPPIDGAFTKIHRRSDGSIRIHKTPRNRILDDVLAFGTPAQWYINGSKEVIPVNSYPMSGVSQAQWGLFYAVSDHLPVKADFDVD